MSDDLKIPNSIKALSELAVNLEKIYAERKMNEWGCLNSERMRMEGRIGRIYNQIDKLTEELILQKENK